MLYVYRICTVYLPTLSEQKYPICLLKRRSHLVDQSSIPESELLPSMYQLLTQPMANISTCGDYIYIYIYCIRRFVYLVIFYRLYHGGSSP